MTLRRIIAAVTMGFCLLGSTGCMTAAKQALYTVVGAQGEFYEVQVVKPAILAGYRAVRVESFTNDLGQRVPFEVVDEVNAQLPEILGRKSSLFYPEGKQLLVRGKIIHYTGRTSLAGSIMSVVGSSEECVCRVQLLDEDSQALIGEAVCWGQTKSALRRGTGELGQGVGKGVAKWIRERLPVEERDRRREELKETQADNEEAPAEERR